MCLDVFVFQEKVLVAGRDRGLWFGNDPWSVTDKAGQPAPTPKVKCRKRAKVGPTAGLRAEAEGRTQRRDWWRRNLQEQEVWASNSKLFPRLGKVPSSPATPTFSKIHL